MRFFPSRWRRRKSGAIRVYYTLFPAIGIVLWITAHSKGEVETISPSEKKIIKQLVDEISEAIRTKRIR